MKKISLISLIMLFAVTTFAGNPNFYKAMGEALGSFSQCRTNEDFQATGNKFLVIANAENEEWLPLYYHAHCYIIMSFNKYKNPEKKDEYLDVAKESIDKMLKLAPGEAEANVLQGLLYTARLTVSPMDRAQKYIQLSGQAVGKALAIEPNNPRARYMKIANEKGTAEFFGEDISVYCDDAKALYDAWDNYEIKSPLYPQWGKNQVAQIMEECN